MTKKIAIIGTRGIPNEYGGFEQFVHYFAPFLVENDIEVTVYSSHTHSFKEKEWKGVKLKHIWNPEKLFGPFGQFIYDLLSILHCRRVKFDIILQLGYTSSSIWSFLLPRRTKIVTNMDGLEWKRSKYSSKVQKFLKNAERWAVNSSDVLVSDSLGIQKYLRNTYNKDSVFIPYASTVYKNNSSALLNQYNLFPGEYNLVIARFEPENNIEIIIQGHLLEKTKRLVLVGNTQTPFGKYLLKKYQDKVTFLGSIYHQEALNELRYQSNLYFHGHSVGGTNPSLLEAMSCSCLIVAHDNDFNKAVLGGDAFYFKSAVDIELLLKKKVGKIGNTHFIASNLKKITEDYSFQRIHHDYLKLFIGLSNANKT
jgi:glycosyltransferase involved in cell wall biosynthesis